MSKSVKIAGKMVGHACPVYITGEIGINHNGDLRIAKRLIDAAFLAGCDAVKFQKRNPEVCVPHDQRNLMRETPWGIMSYLEYCHRVEFGDKEYTELDRYCRAEGIHWFASCWDVESVDFIERYEPVCYKIASASLADDELLKHVNAKAPPMILSTGMSTMDEIRHAASLLEQERLLIAHNQ